VYDYDYRAPTTDATQPTSTAQSIHAAQPTAPTSAIARREGRHLDHGLSQAVASPKSKSSHPDGVANASGVITTAPKTRASPDNKNKNTWGK
jgi:hypothetical protein